MVNRGLGVNANVFEDPMDDEIDEMEDEGTADKWETWQTDEDDYDDEDTEELDWWPDDFGEE
jgi:hypothetical protein